MVVHIRKLLLDDSSKPHPLLSQPPSSLIHDAPKESYNLSPFLIPLFLALGAAFLVVSYFTFIKRYYLSSNDRTRAVSQNLDHDNQDEHLGLVINHPVWLINTIGLEQSVIDSISVFKYKNNEVFPEGIMCSICLSEFESGETLRLLPKCSHAFHMACIDTWLRSHKNCPTCRAEIVSESDINIESSESESNTNSLMPTGETSDENLGYFGEVEGHQESREVGSTENSVELPTKKGGTKIIIMELPCLDTKNFDSRVFSDLVGYREKAEAGQEPVRRSTSMDPSFTSSIYHSMAYIYDTEVEGCSSTELVQENGVKPEKGDNGGEANSKISKIMPTSSLGFPWRKGSIYMKRSASSAN